MPGRDSEMANAALATRILLLAVVFFPSASGAGAHEPERRVTGSETRTPERDSSEIAPGRRGTPFTLPNDFPLVDVTISDDPAAGYLFVANWVKDPKQTPSGDYIMILDDAGWPVFFRKMLGQTWDFKKQPNGLLTYFDRRETGDRRTKGMDSTYTVVEEWLPGGGYDPWVSDGHDFQLLPNGNALLLLFDHRMIDMSQVVPGGCPNAIVRGVVLQEMDPLHNVVFEWRSWDHLEITDAVHEDLTACFVDYVHTNSMEYDTDGNILISNRNIDEVVKIDRVTGDVIWRMGGSQNEFTLVGDTQWFTYQHCARRTATGTITVFDNGSFSSPQESRVVEYQVDEVSKVATRVWEYRHVPAIYANSNGTAQRLPNGNTLISWGTNGRVTEVRNDGTKALDMQFVQGADRTYAAWRFPWDGVAAAPTLWADVTDSLVTLHFTKFGDVNVAQFNVYRGDSPAPTTIVGSTTENFFTLEDVVPGEILYVRVTAEDGAMNESPFSNELEITIPPDPSGVDVTGRNGAGPVLLQNHPNPFAPATTISFLLPERAPVDLSVYDVRGGLVTTVKRGVLGDGLHQAVWDGRDARGRPVSSGVYFYRLTVGSQSLSRAMALRR
jgi:hypothetical protein